MFGFEERDLAGYAYVLNSKELKSDIHTCVKKNCKTQLYLKVELIRTSFLHYYET